VIPQSVKEAIGSRLDRVSAGCNEVLRAAAVVGKTFTFDEVVAAFGSELDYAKQAAAAAEKIFAFDEAIAASSRALECAESLGLDDQQIALEEAIGNATAVGGNKLSAFEHFERALAVSRDPLQRARLQCEAASALVINGDQRGLELLHDALSVLDSETHPIETANALMVEGRFHHLAAKHRKAIELIEIAAALASPKAEGSLLSVFEASTLTTLYPYLAGRISTWVASRIRMAGRIAL
jgi:tetratricopeptide (TPR) repeat protein